MAICNHRNVATMDDRDDVHRQPGFVQCLTCYVLLEAEDRTPAHGLCLEWRGPEGGCRGPVQFHSTDPGRRPAFPRCEAHWNARLDRREHSIERYADSDVAPPWFDPAAAGERWDADY